MESTKATDSTTESPFESLRPVESSERIQMSQYFRKKKKSDQEKKKAKVLLKDVKTTQTSSNEAKTVKGIQTKAGPTSTTCTPMEGKTTTKY